MKKIYITILIALAGAVFLTMHHSTTKIDHNLKPEDYTQNNWASMHSYPIVIAYYDGKPNDTILALYDHTPGNRDIKVWGTEGAYGSHAVPQFWSSSVLNDSTKVYLGVKDVSLIRDPVVIGAFLSEQAGMSQRQ